MNYRRIVVTHPGGPEVLQPVTEPLPEPAGRQVRVRILAAGVSFADIMMREGVYPGMPRFPLTPGYDIIGVVDKVGEDVTEFRTGDRIAALTVTGGYAEYILLSEEMLVSAPADVDPAEAVALVLNYVTAYQMLHRVAQIKQGGSILVHGAAGGVGTALLQLGGLLGLRMIGTASPGKHDLVRSLGGIPLDYRQGDLTAKLRFLAPDGVDAAFDATGEWLFPSYRLLRSGGTLVVYGTLASLNAGRKSLRRAIATYARMSIFLKNLLPVQKRVTLYQITGYRKRHPEWFREDLGLLFRLLKEGKIHPIIAMRRPLEDAAFCHDALNRSSVTGKMVLLPDR